jgi:ATP-binding cassette subfamily B protein
MAKPFYPNTRRFLGSYLEGTGKHYFWGILFLVLTVVTTVTIPRMIRDAVEVLESAGVTLVREDVANLTTAALWIVGLGLLLIIFRVLSRILIFIPGRNVEARIRQDYYEASLSLPPDRLLQYQTGDLISRGTNDITSVRVLLSMGILHIINSVLMIALCLYNMIRISGYMTLICLLTVPMVVVAVRILSGMMMDRVKQVQRQLGNLTETIREQLRAHSLLTVYPIFDSLHSRFEAENADYRRKSESLQAVRVFLFNTSVMLSSLAMFLLVIVGGPRVIDGHFAIAEFVEFSVYLGLIQEPLRAWGFLISIFQRGEVCLKRIFEICDVAADVKATQAGRDVRTTTELIAAGGGSGKALLEIRDLTFQYPGDSGDEDPQRESFSLNIPELTLQEGTKYGVFGATGSGKTTLLKLLSGNLPAEPGTIHFQGIDYAAMTSELVLRQFSIAPQDNRHFDHSIAENIARVRDNPVFADDPGARRTQFDAALHVSQLGPDIDGFTAGLDTVIGEHGVRLSGGQKQRLSILRALLKPRRVLLLDDIVSAVDHETEGRILEALFDEAADETMLIISHRISALAPCDEILILEDGRITDRGTHEALVERHASYGATWKHQVLEQQLEALADDD